MVTGYVQSRVGFFLMNLHIAPRSILMCRVGNCVVGDVRSVDHYMRLSTARLSLFTRITCYSTVKACSMSRARLEATLICRHVDRHLRVLCRRITRGNDVIRSMLTSPLNIHAATSSRPTSHRARILPSGQAPSVVPFKHQNISTTRSSNGRHSTRLTRASATA